MILFECEQCKVQNSSSESIAAPPRHWVSLSTGVGKALVCCWRCSEKFSARMAANQEHPGNDGSRIPPARVKSAVDDASVESAEATDAMMRHLDAVEEIARHGKPITATST